MVGRNPTNKLIRRGSIQERPKPFPLRAYAVLATVSRRYSPLQGRSPRVTHPCATKVTWQARALVRLACVKHAASVRSEPGSNSQVDPPNSPLKRKTSQEKQGANPAHFRVILCDRNTQDKQLQTDHKASSTAARVSLPKTTMSKSRERKQRGAGRTRALAAGAVYTELAGACQSLSCIFFTAIGLPRIPKANRGREPMLRADGYPPARQIRRIFLSTGTGTEKIRRRPSKADHAPVEFCTCDGITPPPMADRLIRSCRTLPEIQLNLKNLAHSFDSTLGIARNRLDMTIPPRHVVRNAQESYSPWGGIADIYRASTKENVTETRTRCS